MLIGVGVACGFCKQNHSQGHIVCPCRQIAQDRYSSTLCLQGGECREFDNFKIVYRRVN